MRKRAGEGEAVLGRLPAEALDEVDRLVAATEANADGSPRSVFLRSNPAR